jgi:hypothetical protein
MLYYSSWMDANVAFAIKLFVLVVLLLYNLDIVRNWTSLLVNPGLYFTVISHNITFFRMHFFHECICNSAYILLCEPDITEHKK